MWRNNDQVLPLEQNVLRIAKSLRRNSDGTGTTGEGWFHAYGLAEELEREYDTGLLANGTLYRSLRGMASREWLERRVETDEEAGTHSGPPRRYYRITHAGELALARATSRPSKRARVTDSIGVRTATSGP